MLDHFTFEPVPSPQRIKVPFDVSLTARDALGFPLTGITQSQMTALQQSDPQLADTLAAGGYAGTATLTDTAGLLAPRDVTFAGGTAQVAITFPSPVEQVRL